MLLLNALFIVAAILTGVSLHNRRSQTLKKPLPMLVWEAITKVRPKPLITSAPTTSPLFGERPHYFTPPSDMEQYRIRSRKKVVSLLNGDGEHHVIPYPNDPPHTFPAIKARQLFTRPPKNLREVYIPEVDPVERTNLRRGAKLTVPLQQLEERYRTVYENAKRNNLEITVNAMPENELREWEKLGYKHTRTYDFHDLDGLVSPPLEDVSKKEPIWEEM